MKRFFAAFFMVLAATAVARADDFALGDLIIRQPWSRATPAKTGAVWLVIKNRGMQPDRLIAVKSEIAEQIELHQMRVENGVMTMRSVEGLDVPAGGQVMLAPGGWHFMLLGLKKPLTAGDGFMIELTFEHAGSISVPVTVQAASALTPAP